MFSKLFKNKIKNIIYDIAGNKESLAIRLAKHDLNQSPQSKGKEQLAEYLNLSQKKITENSEIHQHYKATFNAVDQFNRYLHMISFKMRFDSIEFRILVGYIEIALVQSWALYLDFENGEQEETKIRKVAKEIATRLHDEATKK